MSALRTGVALACLGILLHGCETGADPTARRTPPPPSPETHADPAAFEYIERCIGAPCDASLPTLVVIHGLGDRPEAFIALYSGLTRPVRVLALRAPLAWGGGFAWFPYRARTSTRAQMAAAIVPLVPRVLATIDGVCRVRSCDGRVVVSGFSQGAMMSFAIAALAPARITHAFPVSGVLVTGVDPVPSVTRPIVRAFHGSADPVVESQYDVESVARLRAADYDATLTLAPGVGHTIPPDTRAMLLRGIDDALPPLQ